MKGYQLTFSTLQGRKHPSGDEISQWLLKTATSLGIQGVTIIHASEGIGRDGKRHSAHFFELTDEPIEVILNVSEEKCNALFNLLEEEKLGFFYTKTAIEFGTI